MSKSETSYSYIINLPIEYKMKIKSFCIKNDISIKKFIKAAIDLKLEEMKEEDRDVQLF